MRPRILLTILVAVLFMILSGCGNVANCPICGTTSNGGYGVIDVITVPEHNPTGEPGGPFNSFDISWVAKNPTGKGDNLDYVSDRIGLAIDVFDTSNDLAVNAIQGTNAVTGAGNQASPCATDPETGNDLIPPLISVFGNFTRYGCRTDLSWEGGSTFHLGSGFGANHHFGGFPGAQCCASRANGVNPMSGPDGLEVSDDGTTLFVANGSASVVVFDLTTMDLTQNPPTPPTVLADIPTGVSADYDGPLGIAPCVASWNGGAGSAADCGDDRADEMSFDNTNKVLAIINGDPGLPFITFIDMSHVVTKTGTAQQQHCLPIDQNLAYGPWAAPSQISGDPTDFPTYPSQAFSQTWVIPQPGASFNPPSCILGQIYYDGAGGAASGGLGLNAGVPVDTVGGSFPCPDPSNPQVFGGVSGSLASLVPGIGITPSGTAYTIPCHHGPILDQSLGTFCSQTAPGGTCAGAIAPAGLGGMVWNEGTGHLLLANENSIGITNVGNIDEIDPQLANTACGGVSCGPVVVNSYVMLNCMPTSVTQGPGTNYLVGCADHDGEAFPPNEYIINGTTGAILTQIYNVGGVDETWYNPGDNKYYLAARDMPNGPVLGVIDAGTNLWLQNAATGSNSHSVAVDPNNNHVFVPLQAGGLCQTQSSNGCVGVYAQQ
ncbi:MAG: hypothetical protein ACLP0H_14330 [Terriglobales bacterium]